MKESNVVLVTGASSGFGKETAQYLSKKGFRVYGSSRKCFNGEKAGDFTMVNMDVTNEESVRDAVNYILDREGKIDVLYNNAGMGISGSIEDTTLEEAKLIFETNFFGMMRVTRAVLPNMRKMGQGYIINTSSIGGIIGLPFQGLYSASKFAVEGFTEALSKEVKGFGIKVCMIEPGDFKTGFTANRRYVKNSAEGSAYREAFLKNMKFIENEENNGCEPIEMAKIIYKIINTKNPKLRYKIGFKSQKLAASLKKFLPERLYEDIVIRFYS